MTKAQQREMDRARAANLWHISSFERGVTSAMTSAERDAYAATFRPGAYYDETFCSGAFCRHCNLLAGR